MHRLAGGGACASLGLGKDGRAALLLSGLPSRPETVQRLGEGGLDFTVTYTLRLEKAWFSWESIWGRDGNYSGLGHPWHIQIPSRFQILCSLVPIQTAEFTATQIYKTILRLHS